MQHSSSTVPRHVARSTRGRVFDIQRFSLHDGPGIRTLVFLKGCPLSCRWCANPEGIAFHAQLMYAPTRCIACGSCIEACPHGALTRGQDPPVRIDRTRCRNCGTCAGICPSGALSLSGTEMTVDEVMAEVEKDLVFYQQSGGGLTISGGEPLAQPEFTLGLLQAARQLAINTAIETCGHVPSAVVRQILPYVDYLLFDIKHMDATTHRTYTGQDNELILANARIAASQASWMRVRVPVIPGFNDSQHDILGIAEFVASLALKSMDLLPYHRLGASKYRSLGREAPMESIKPPSEEYMEKLKRSIEDTYPIKISIGG